MSVSSYLNAIPIVADGDKELSLFLVMMVGDGGGLPANDEGPATSSKGVSGGEALLGDTLLVSTVGGIDKDNTDVDDAGDGAGADTGVAADMFLSSFMARIDVEDETGLSTSMPELAEVIYVEVAAEAELLMSLGIVGILNGFVPVSGVILGTVWYTLAEVDVLENEKNPFLFVVS